MNSQQCFDVDCWHVGSWSSVDFYTSSNVELIMGNVDSYQLCESFEILPEHLEFNFLDLVSAPFDAREGRYPTRKMDGA